MIKHFHKIVNEFDNRLTTFVDLDNSIDPELEYDDDWILIDLKLKTFTENDPVIEDYNIEFNPTHKFYFHKYIKNFVDYLNENQVLLLKICDYDCGITFAYVTKININGNTIYMLFDYYYDCYEGVNLSIYFSEDIEKIYKEI